MKFVTIYKNPDKFSSFPTIAILPNDKVLVAFRRAGQFSVNAAKNDEPTHHDTDSAIFLIESSDGGESYAEDSLRMVTESNFGLNDPGLTLLSDGRLLLRSTVMQICKYSDRDNIKGPISAHRPDLGTLSSVLGQVVQYSDDLGKSWSSAKMIAVKGSHHIFVSREQIVELEDKSLLMSVYTGKAVSSDNSYIIRSWDSANSWQDESLIAADEKGVSSIFQGISFNETAILNLGKGKMISLIRADSDYHTDESYMAIGGIGQLFQSYSYNAGFSWTKPKATGIFGQPAHLLKLSDGRLLCTYGYRKDPFSIRAVFSLDEGKTWDIDKTIILKDKCVFWDMGYPVSAQRDDGKIITVYYWVDNEKTRYIESVIWEIPND